ncbi:MAG TPA: hypothetical protein VFF84_02370 [Sphingobium sp.]|nr:hypothetical protein [Sphingobium sp.]
MNSELERAREKLAEAEAALAAGINPYAERNVATHRARVARLEAAAKSAAPVAPPSPAPVAAVKPQPAPQLLGTREERLQRLAKVMSAGADVLAEALANGTSPDAFAVQVVDSRDPDSVAARILNSDKPVANRQLPEVEEMAQRILNA